MKCSHIVLAMVMIPALLSHSAEAKYPRGGAGVAGKVLSVSDRYFTFDTNNGVVKVFVSANTNFEKRGRHSDSSEVKDGVSARVTGHVTNDGVWEAYKVSITDT